MFQEMKDLIVSAFSFQNVEDEVASEQTHWVKISERETSERKSLLAHTNFKQENVSF